MPTPTPTAPTRPVALVTTDLDAIGEFDRDLEVMLPALAAEGVTAHLVRWDDPDVDWSAFAAVVMRSPWDYPQRLDAFTAWLDTVEPLTTVINCAATIRWNLDKRYLAALADAGVAVVPTTFADTPAQLTAALTACTTPWLVVKPHVSAGSRDTGLFARDDPAAVALGETILASNRTVLVQPAIPEVARSGEHALVYVDGMFSHAFTKGPILAPGGGMLGGTYTEHLEPVTPTVAERTLADAAVAAIVTLGETHGCRCSGSVPLYARIDLVAGEGGPLVLEAELFEPSYALDLAPDRAPAFARALRARLDADSPVQA